jgi:lactate dehydrogenase-like 2-hydroxyacid dehydrogenase
MAMTKLLSAQMQQLEERFDVIHLYAEKDPEAVLQERKGDVQGIIASPNNPIRKNLMEALPALEIISMFAVGYDNIDLESAIARHVKITNTPDVLSADTADTAVALLLSVSRRIVEGDMYVRIGQWHNGPMPLGVSLANKTVGIVGLGRIGQAIAKRLAAFDMNIVYHGRSEKKDMPYQYYEDLETMAEISDYMVLACAGGEDTKNLINKDVLEALGADGFLINIARGSVVDEAALVEALQNKTIRGAGLDVYAQEPFVPEELRQMDNVVLLPHIGSATFETRSVMGNIVVENLINHFEGKALLTEVA